MKSDAGTQPKTAEKVVKEENSNMRFAVLLVLWLLINMVWATLHQQPSLNQANVPGHSLLENQTIEVPDIIGMGRPVPLELRCDFEIAEEASAVVQGSEVGVSVNITSSEGALIYSWKGTVADDCTGWSGELEPGRYGLHTSIAGNDEWVDATIEYDIFVLENLAIEGFILANLIGGLLASTELPARRRERRQRQKPVKGSWKPKSWDISAATREVDVGDFHDPLADGENVISDSIQRQRESYEREMERSPLPEPEPEHEPVFAAQPKEQPDDLGEGDLRGMKGELKSDKRIKTVSDIYDLMEGPED